MINCRSVRGFHLTRRGLLAVSLFQLFSFFLAAAPVLAQPKPGAAPPAPMPVEAHTVVAAPHTTTATVLGSLRPNESVVIRPEVAGRVTSIGFQEGQTVKQGSVLFKLNTNVLDANLAESRAALKLAEAGFTRLEGLRGKSLVSQQEFDESNARLEQARASVTAQEAALAKMTLTAPFGGIVGVRQVSLGAYVKEGDAMVTLDDIDPIKVDAYIPEAYISQVRQNQKFTAEFDAYPGERFAGEVYAIDTAIDPAARTLLLRGRIPNPKRVLRPGMFARIQVILSESEQAISIPEQAIVPAGDSVSVYKVVDGKAVMTKVTVGARETGRVFIRQGLKAGDVVVTAGQAKLRDGAPVIVAAAAPPKASETKP